MDAAAFQKATDEAAKVDQRVRERILTKAAIDPTGMWSLAYMVMVTELRLREIETRLQEMGGSINRLWPR